MRSRIGAAMFFTGAACCEVVIYTFYGWLATLLVLGVGLLILGAGIWVSDDRL